MFLSSYKNFITKCVRHIISVEVSHQAAALAYTTMLSLVPLLVIALFLLGSLPVFSGARMEVEQYLLSHLVVESAVSVKEYLVTFIHQAHDLSLCGIVILVFSSLLLFFEIGGAFNKIWQVDKVRKSYFSTLLAVVFFLLVPLFFALITVFEYYLANFMHNVNFSTAIVLNGYAFLVSAFMFSVFYKLIPGANVKNIASGLGGIVASALFILFRKVFVLYFSYFSNYKILYGALYAVPVFMLWLYLSWLIILLGAVVSYIFQENYA